MLCEQWMFWGDNHVTLKVAVGKVGGDFNYFQNVNVCDMTHVAPLPAGENHGQCIVLVWRAHYK